MHYSHRSMGSFSTTDLAITAHSLVCVYVWYSLLFVCTSICECVYITVCAAMFACMCECTAHFWVRWLQLTFCKLQLSMHNMIMLMDRRWNDQAAKFVERKKGRWPPSHDG